MKDQLKEALIKLQRLTGQNALVKIQVFSKDQDKNVTAQLYYEQAGEAAVDIIDSNGYNRKYIIAKLRSNFRSVMASVLAYAGSGDNILIRSLSSPPAPGTQVPLSGSTYYYAVNGGLISCNGQQLGTSFQSIYIGPRQGKCNSSGAVMNYSELKLI